MEIMPQKSSNNWKKVRLGDICESIDYGFTASADFSARGPRLLRITDIQGDRVDWSRVPGCRLTGEGHEDKQLRDGDIVFARTGATTGKSFLVTDPPNAVFASYLIRLRLINGVDREFVNLYFRSDAYWRKIREGARGGAQPNFNASMLAELEVPSPPLIEQRQIAAALKEQLAEVEHARAAVEAQSDAARVLMDAELRKELSAPRTASWPSRPMSELCSMRTGQVDPREKAYAALPHVSAENIASVTGELLGLRSASEDGMISGKYLFDAGDVLYSKLRPYLRKAAIARASGVCSADMYPLQPSVDVDARYLRWSLVAERFTAYANDQSQRSRMPKLNREQLFAWKMPIPNIATQSRVADRLDAVAREAASVTGALRVRMNDVERLPAALLRQAFGAS